MMAAMDADRRMPDLTSTANPRVKAIARLRDRRERERTGLTIVDGAREVRRAIEAGATVDEAFVCTPLLQGEDARAALDALDEVSRSLRAKPAQVSLAWLMSRPAVSAPIASATTLAQLRELMGAAALALDETALRRLDRASD